MGEDTMLYNPSDYCEKHNFTGGSCSKCYDDFAELVEGTTKNTNCNWTMEDEEALERVNLWETDCGHTIPLPKKTTPKIMDFNWCPFCGRAIIL